MSFGAYVPRARLQRAAVFAANRWFAPGLKRLAKGERAIANWDEDSITMGVEAARGALAGEERANIRALFLASTSFPYIDRLNSGIVKEALNLDDHVGALDIGGSQRAGTSMLIQALGAAESASGPILAVAAEKRRALPASEDELVNGDAAAALVVGAGDGIARLVAVHSLTSDFVDHFRAEGLSTDYGWEARWTREEGHLKLGAQAVGGVLEAAGLSPGDVNHLAVGIPAKGAAAALARKTGIAAEAICPDLSAEMGSAGSAHALILLVAALERAAPGDHILLLGFGQGADALLFEVTEAITGSMRSAGLSAALSAARKEDNYLKYLALAGHLPLERGKRADFEQKPVLTALYRNRRAVLGLVGSKCTVSGAVQFPPSEIGVAQNAPALGSQQPYPLSDIPARVVTFTADNLTYTPDPPGYYGMIDFEGGGRMLAEFTDAVEGEIAVGTEVRMMFRIKHVDERSGFVKYFWKAVPAARGV